jgi:hypothetical protein
LQFERRDCWGHGCEFVPGIKRLKRYSDAFNDVFEIRATVEDRNEETKKGFDLFVSRLKTKAYECRNETNLVSRFFFSTRCMMG